MMKLKQLPSFLFLIVVAADVSGYELRAADTELIQRRMRALNAATDDGSADTLARIAAFRDEPNALVRRAAVRSLAKLGLPALDQLKSYATDDTDPLVRRTALRAFTATSGEEAARLALLSAVLKQDKDELVRSAAVEELANIEPRTPEVLALLQKAQGEASTLVSKTALNALWTYNAAVVSARDRPAYQDTALSATRIEIPGERWRIKADPAQNGHLQNWTFPAFDDADWEKVGIGEVWRGFGAQNGTVAWYRLTFQLPAEPESVATDLVFDGVDEAAWVWVNGVFLGTHNIGPEGYNKRFAVDTRDVLKWGGENTIVVRVLKTIGTAGGIWKPVYLEALNH